MTAGPGELEIIGLGAFAGLTIFLGMPFATARGLSPRLRAALSAFAAGILVYIFFDVLANASTLLDAVHASSGTGVFLDDSAVLLLGFLVGMGGLVVFEIEFSERLQRRSPAADVPTAPVPLSPVMMATLIAVGIGLHNFAEGLAIGASYASGALGLGVVLVVGFAIHNSTEGFGILGPGMMANVRFSVRRLLALGAVGGAPTLFGTIVGSLFVSTPLSVLFYGLAAGAILFVVMRLARPMMGPGTQHVAMAGLAAGFAVGYLTDLVVTLGGA